VNCAASLDGRLAFAGGRRAALSSPEDLVRVQRLRANADAILVGVGTVVADDPSLRVHWDLLGEPPGREPTRVVVDASGRTPGHARVLAGGTPTIVATSEENVRSYPAHVIVMRAGHGSVDLTLLFEQLYAHGTHRLLVEGGAQVLASVLREGLFDRLTIYYAPLVIGGTTAPPVARGPETLDLESAVRLRFESTETVGAGYVATYRPVRPGLS
jgi:2,5-diamino-6-(ribosylamino)-4(3H)-pyrimidinone 5'-phosphate reductase